MLTFERLLFLYCKQIFDAFIAILMISYISPKIQFDHMNVLKTSFMIGTILFLLDLYDEDLHKTCKSSMFYSLGNSWV